MRDDIDIVIPTQRESAELDQTVADLAAHTAGYCLSVRVEPSLNVSECRQAAMDAACGRYLCFMDDDAHQLSDGWLDEMLAVLQAAPNAAVVYAGEHWGSDTAPAIVVPDAACPWEQVDYGPAACMLIDRDKVPAGVKWCAPLGLSNGWLGGDFEEVDYAKRIREAGGKLYRARRTLFDHRGGKSTMLAFSGTDRFQVIRVINALLKGWDTSAPGWWDNLHRVAADPNDDCAFSPSVVNPLRSIFNELLVDHGIAPPGMRDMGIVD